MKYHAFCYFLKKQQNLKLSSAANYSGALWVSDIFSMYIVIKTGTLDKR